MENLYDVAKKINEDFFPDCDFVPTIGGRGQHHPRNLVGNLYRIRDPKTVSVGNCFLNGRLKEGDLFICTNHSGDCFQDYMYVHEYGNCLVGEPRWTFGSYGIGNSEIVELKEGKFGILATGGRVERDFDILTQLLCRRHCKSFSSGYNCKSCVRNEKVSDNLRL